MYLKKSLKPTAMITEDRLEKFLNNELSKQETELFQKELLTEPDLRKEMQVRKEIEDALNDTDFKMFRDNLEEIVQSEKSKNGKVRFFEFKTPSFRWLVAAASIAMIIVGANAIYVLKGKTFQPKDLVSMYYKPYDSYINVRSGNINTDDIFIKALMKYEKKDYNEAIFLLNKVLEVDNNNVASLFYLGVSYVETDRFADAFNAFNKIVDHGDNLFVDQAKWYLGLTYLKSNEKDKAKVQFAEIADSQSFYKDKAKELLKQF